MDKSIKLFHTTHEISERFGIPQGSLQNLRWQRRGPRYYKVGRKVLYREADVQAWIESSPVLTIDSME